MSPTATLSALARRFFAAGRVYLVAALVLCLSAGLLVLNQFIAWTVFAGERPVASFDRRSTAKKAVETALVLQERRYGLPVTTREELEIRPAWRGKYKDLAQTGSAARLLSEKLNFVAACTAVVIDGRLAVLVRDHTTAQRVLAEVKDRYRPGGVADVKFAEQVEMVNKQVHPSLISSPEEAARVLLGEQEREKNYRISPGDTLWSIARREGCSLEQLLALNDGINPRLLQVGEEIKLPGSEPVLNVICSYEQVVMEELPFRVMEREDQSLAFGERVVIQQGIPGRVAVTYRVVERNGRVVEKRPVRRLVTQKPRPEIVATGSKMVLVSRSGRGTYLPVRGKVSSPFGLRHGRMHGGIDYAANHGDPVVAMAAGKVKFAGYHGGYGLMVDIDHGGDLVTRYAHLASIMVEPGEKVSGGQLIGRVGSSGSATGPHLHFEVLRNNVPQNPADYLGQ